MQTEVPNQIQEHPPLQPALPIAWPKDAKDVRDFFHADFISAKFAAADQTPCNEDRYLISAHDFLSAVNWWANFPHVSRNPQAAPLPLLMRDIARDHGITALEACQALKDLGNFSVNTAVTEEMAAKLRELFPVPQAAPAAVAVPDGWKLVPVKPTKEMLLAAGFSASAHGQSTTGLERWQAFLNNAPTPPSQARAALDATPAALEVPAEGDPASLLQLADLLESGRHLIHVERKEVANALRTLAATPAAAPILISSLQSILADADVGPPTDSQWCCKECGRWTPWHHPEAHDHEEGCTAPSEYAKRRDWKSRLSTLIAATPEAATATGLPAQAVPYSLDLDPLGIRALAASAITGALSFGATGGEKPPAGHWLEWFYQAGAEKAPQAQAFQQRVQPWMMACFGPEISADSRERNHRFLEEALELVQSCGCTASEAHQLVDYVYGRPWGEPAQEAGGVMVTLAALCLANGLDMHACGETELARIWTKVEAIRAKQAAKPKHSPLPMHAPQAQADAQDALAFKAAIEKLPRYTYGFKSDDWGMGSHLQSYQDPEGKFLNREEVIAAIAAAKGDTK